MTDVQEKDLRAYSLVKAQNIDVEKRLFSGIATTPSLDRVNDSINPMGAKFAKEIPLLHAHRHDMPIGVVRLGKATKDGIPFEAEIPVIHEPASLKDRVDTAWGELVHGLVRAVSIGFRPTKSPEFNDSGGLDFPDVEIFELSTVAIPAQSEALIHTIKSFDDAAMKKAGTDTKNSADDTTAAPGKKSRVVKLSEPARVRAPFKLLHVKTRE